MALRAAAAPARPSARQRRARRPRGSAASTRGRVREALRAASARASSGDQPSARHRSARPIMFLGSPGDLVRRSRAWRTGSGRAAARVAPSHAGSSPVSAASSITALPACSRIDALEALQVRERGSTAAGRPRRPRTAFPRAPRRSIDRRLAAADLRPVGLDQHAVEALLRRHAGAAGRRAAPRRRRRCRRWREPRESAWRRRRDRAVAACCGSWRSIVHAVSLRRRPRSTPARAAASARRDAG